MNCERCKMSLVSKVELDLETCYPCLKKQGSELKALHEANEALAARVERLNRTSKNIENLSDRVKRRTEAGEVGRVARTRQISIDQNPFAPGMEEHIEWEIGWLRADLGIWANETRSELEKSVAGLLAVRELIVGSADPSEVVQKLDVVTATIMQAIGIEG